MSFDRAKDYRKRSWALPYPKQKRCWILQRYSVFPETSISSTLRARVKYYTALAHFKLGETETANALFRELKFFCPELNYALLAQKYLEGLDAQQKREAPHAPSPLPKELRPRTTKSLFVFIVLPILLIAAFIFLLHTGSKFTGTPAEILNRTDLDFERTGIVEIINTIPLDDEGNSLVVFKDETFAGVAYFKHLDSDIYEYETKYNSDLPLPDVENGYYITAGDIDLKIKFAFTSENATIPGEAQSVTEITCGEQDIYFYITAIEPHRCTGYSSGIRMK